MHGISAREAWPSVWRASIVSITHCNRALNWSHLCPGKGVEGRCLSLPLATPERRQRIAASPPARSRNFCDSSCGRTWLPCPVVASNKNLRQALIRLVASRLLLPGAMRRARGPVRGHLHMPGVAVLPGRADGAGCFGCKARYILRQRVHVCYRTTDIEQQ